MNDSTTTPHEARTPEGDGAPEVELVDWVGLKRAAAWWTAGLVLLALLASRVLPVPTEATTMEPAAAR